MTELPPRSPAYELCLVLRQAAEHFVGAYARLRPLAASLDGSLVLSTNLHYRRETDTALVTLRLDWARLTRARADEIVRAVGEAGASVLEPARLPDRERNRFYGSYLPLYGQRASNLPTLDDALRLLLRWLGLPPPAPAPAERPPAARVEVRFRRGDRWQLGRPRSLSAEGLYVATGCPPRYGDVIELEVSCLPARVLTQAAVLHVTTADAASSVGIAGFGARFLVAHGAERRRLHDVLAAARGAAAQLAPPPRRRDPRYPCRWPVLVKLPGSTFSTSALDVSRHGIFVAGELPRADAVEVTLVPGDGGAPVRATARRARDVSPKVARARGLLAGCGLELQGLSARDAERYDRFVEEIAGRAARFVVVGAAHGRAAAIGADLQAAGYAVATASDPTTLVTRAAAAARAPDLVVLDDSLDGGDERAGRIVRRALSARQIPIATVSGQPVTAARAMADRVLL